MEETAVEWLVRMLYSPICNGFLHGQRRMIPFDIIEKAKAMDKEQKIKAYLQGSFDDGPNVNKAEQYYNEKYHNEIYVSPGSNDTTSHNN